MKQSKHTSKQTKYSFIQFMDNIITQLHANGQHKTWQHYRSTLNSFLRFRNNKDISLRRIDTTLITSYETYLKQHNICRNTTSFYMRILRAVYNRAVAQHLITQQHPFHHVYTGIDKTTKRAIPLTAISNIQQLNLSHTPSTDMAKDTFLLCFYLRSISFIDLAHLKKTDIRNGYLHYNRSKTRQPITIKWEQPMQQLADKYSHLTANTPYLFPFLINTGKDPKPDHQLYHNVESRITYHLKKIQQQTGLNEPLTLYVARHSWATAARDLHYPTSIISEALGHDSETTTQIYLRTIKTSEIDQLNTELLTQLQKIRISL